MGDDAKAGAATTAPALVFTVHILDYARRTIGRYDVSTQGGTSVPERREARKRVVAEAAQTLLDRALPGMREHDYNIIAGFRVEGP